MNPVRSGLGLIGGLLALMLVATVWLQGRQLSVAEMALRTNDSFSVLSLYQVEIETLRLQEQWHQTLHADAPDLDTLQLRYDVWVSRVGLADTPAIRKLMAGDDTFDATLAQLRAFIQQADQVFGPKVPQPPAAADLRPLTTSLEAMAPPVHAMTLAAAHRVAEHADATNRALRHQSRMGVALSVFLCALCAAFALLAMRQMRQLQQRRAALEDLTARLREAQQHADAANAAKSQFLANMSHEIRTPFQGLLGMLNLMGDGSLSARQREQLRMATDSAEHLLAILNDILDLSQLEQGRMQLHLTPLDLPALLLQVEAVMRPPAAAKSLLMQISTEPGVPHWIEADATRVKQVLFNLLSNAIKFSHQGSVTLDVQTVQGPPERLRFIVTDTGMGMDRATTERLFRRRRSNDPPAARPSSGAGLGLEISRNLARLMGGDIQVQSEPGEGSRFTFEIPLQRPAKVPAALSLPPDTAVPQRPLRVLVAEDHAINRQYLAALLERMQHQAHFVANGRDAVQVLGQQPFDLVLMDLHMPELDGIAATQAIRALGDRAAATVPIIALTADAFQGTRDRCLLAGMNDFLPKPVSPLDLAAALRRLFGQEAADPAPDHKVAAPALNPAVPLIDQAGVDRVRDGLGPAKLAMLIQAFLDQAPQAVTAMRAAVREGQPLALRAQAHAARGAALNLGLSALAQTAQALHEGAALLPAHEVAHLVHHYETLIERTQREAADLGLLGPPADARQG